MRHFPAIHNWQMQPPPGGWSFTHTINGETYTSQGSNPTQVKADLIRFSIRAGAELREHHAEDLLNEEWKRRDPVRAIGRTQGEPGPKKPEPRNAHLRDGKPSYHGPSQWGNAIWLYLNTFPMPGAWDKAQWDATIDRITYLLNKAKSPGTGCADCFQEWMLICKLSDPKKVMTGEAAAAFVFRAHNTVNDKLGKPMMTWKEAIYKFGWNIRP